jgi:hypothetical protein
LFAEGYTFFRLRWWHIAVFSFIRKSVAPHISTNELCRWQLSQDRNMNNSTDDAVMLALQP